MCLLLIVKKKKKKITRKQQVGQKREMEGARHGRRRVLGAGAAGAAAAVGEQGPGRWAGGLSTPAGGRSPVSRPGPLPHAGPGLPLLICAGRGAGGCGKAPSPAPPAPLPDPPGLPPLAPPPATSDLRLPPHCPGAPTPGFSPEPQTHGSAGLHARPPSTHTLRPSTPRTRISQKAARPHSSPPSSPGRPCRGLAAGGSSEGWRAFSEVVVSLPQRLKGAAFGGHLGKEAS